MDMQAVLLAAISALAGAIGVMWFALQAKIAAAEKGCAEDRAKLWELVRTVSQLDRRRDGPLYSEFGRAGETP